MSDNTKKLVESIDYLADQNRECEDHLRSAACELGDWLDRQIPYGETLPRGYTLRRIRSVSAGAETTFLADGDGHLINSRGGFFCGDFSTPTPRATLPALRRLAADVADGWLAEVRQWLTVRSALLKAQATELEAR